MKSHSRLMLAIGFTAVCASSRVAECQKMGAVTHTPLHDIQLTLDKADIDEHILALARAEDATLLADSTHFPKNTDLLSESTTTSFGNYLLFMAYQRHLTWVKVGAGDNGRGAFTLWPEEDLKALAQEVLDAPVPWINKDASALEWQPVKQYVKDVAGTEGEPIPQYRDFYPHTTLDGFQGDISGVAEKRSQELGPLLMSYLQQVQGWNGTANGLQKKIPVVDLPPALRDNILARLQGQMFNPRKIAGAKLWFDQQQFGRLAHLSVEKGGVYSAQPLWLDVDIETEDNISSVLGLPWNPYTPPTPRAIPGIRRMKLELGQNAVPPLLTVQRLSVANQSNSAPVYGLLYDAALRHRPTLDTMSDGSVQLPPFSHFLPPTV